ncbi:MAG: DegV family protein [Anaerolineales bacterium]|nr:DegV family protein [Anaerolineales bacterium]
MDRIAVVTDTTASIPEDLLSALNIHTVAYYIHRGEEVLLDLVTITRDAFYSWMNAAEELPKTACPGPGDYLAQYKELISQGIHDIISIHMTSEGSGAYQSALNAKETLQQDEPDIHIEVVDTRNVAMAHGWIVIEAARAALAGANLAKVRETAENMIPITHMIQTADTLKYLYMGGRIGKATHLFGSLLHIKPLISMQDGIIISIGQSRSRGQAYRKMVEIISQNVGAGGKIKIAYLHAAALAEAEQIKILVEQKLDVIESFFAELSPALGVHTGPGTAGVCYFPVV